jgi:hypothetical protein
MLMKRCTGTAGVLFGLLMLGSAGISGCGSGSGDTTDGNITRLAGNWSLVKTSGGLLGNGYLVTPGMEILTFNTNGTFVRTINGQTTSGTYKVTDRTTFLYVSNLKYPVITYSPQALADVVSQVDSQHLVVNEEAADGYSREYERLLLTSQ